jgi:hypothetical protein
LTICELQEEHHPTIIPEIHAEKSAPFEPLSMNCPETNAQIRICCLY